MKGPSFKIWPCSNLYIFQVVSCIFFDKWLKVSNHVILENVVGWDHPRWKWIVFGYNFKHHIWMKHIYQVFSSNFLVINESWMLTWQEAKYIKLDPIKIKIAFFFFQKKKTLVYMSNKIMKDSSFKVRPFSNLYIFQVFSYIFFDRRLMDSDLLGSKILQIGPNWN